MATTIYHRAAKTPHLHWHISLFSVSSVTGKFLKLSTAAIPGRLNLESLLFRSFSLRSRLSEDITIFGTRFHRVLQRLDCRTRTDSFWTSGLCHGRNPRSLFPDKFSIAHFFSRCSEQMKLDQSVGICNLLVTPARLDISVLLSQSDDRSSFVTF